MHPQEILPQVAEIIAKVSGVDVEEVQLDRHLTRDLGLDSLALVETAVRIEDAFGFRVEDADIQQFSTVQSLTELILARAPKLETAEAKAQAEQAKTGARHDAPSSQTSESPNDELAAKLAELKAQH